MIKWLKNFFYLNNKNSENFCSIYLTLYRKKKIGYCNYKLSLPSVRISGLN